MWICPKTYPEKIVNKYISVCYESVGKIILPQITLKITLKCHI